MALKNTVAFSTVVGLRITVVGQRQITAAVVLSKRPHKYLLLELLLLLVPQYPQYVITGISLQ